MGIKEQINQDLKSALLAGDKTKATILRGLKAAILNLEVEKSAREQGLDEDVIVALMAKEAKKRQESADLYQKGNRAELAQAELHEKAIIQAYLPAQLSDQELARLVDEAIQKLGLEDAKAMGQVIGAVKATAGSQADGGRIAAAVKARLTA